ncbi:MAG: indolepyruvate ferredoxin oxidoreductase family protein, partial [Pseudomonadota bacterium]
MGLRQVALDDKYTLLNGRIFVTGIQALVRLPMLQKLRDQRAGLNTAGYISGYRGSPLGALDQQLVKASHFLAEHDIVFQPGLNEELAATACSGTQQINLQGEGAYDGVFCMWYGKGPGVDRSGDAFRHANNFGTAEHGGMIALLGDDHACESSTTAHQSEFAMVDAMIPVLNPAGVQDILDYGLYGIAMSRYTGGVVGLKCVHDSVEATASIEISDDRTSVVIPDDFDMPQGGLNIRRPDTFLDQENRVHHYKLEAAKAFVRSNQLDQCVINPPDAWLGIATTGKSYLDVRQ